MEEIDDDLRLAIELSLQDANRDEEDEDLQRALALSQAEVNDRIDVSSSQSSASSVTKPDQNFAVADASDTFLLNRANMERDRLERLRKRVADASSDEEPFSKRFKTAGENRRYWEASVGNTCSADFVLDSLIDARNLRSGLFSSFDWGNRDKGVEWIADRLGKDTDAYFVVHEPGKPRVVQASPKRNLLYPPIPANFGTMHVKLMLLIFQDCLRVVITSANLTQRDWSTVDNVVFVQDFPPRASPFAALPSFGDYLHKYLKLLTEHKFVEVLKEYDFSSAKAELVGSTPAAHSFGIDFCGLGRLAAVTKKLGFKPKEGYNVEYQTSSLGALKLPWLHLFYAACAGSLPHSPSTSAPPPPFRVLFPTSDSVLAAGRRGSFPEGCEAICLERKWYEAPMFPKSVLRDSVSTRPGAISHAKVMVVERNAGKTLKDQSRENNGSGEAAEVKDGVKGWVYYGSHNCTQSAWGTIAKSRTTSQRECRTNNYELGVLIPLREGDNPPFVPYKRPPEEYGTRQPWFRMEHLAQGGAPGGQ
ncbi:phospholipase D/nuclease [Gonapodya prolifera JEL478]|uniref:Phospholipase D/nuclease n=1 Tax=Gonapodya prolifera (strain JEL478) TaxID=1344416 RepID=A0A139ATD9_GONPJ|nr:phospholipase D/nuclease [Gonapodya prolifera JEL478]|eukprot:KXS20000.1 phospholipase D/nuclease [Gonapodya prolifera JEL478]